MGLDDDLARLFYLGGRDSGVTGQFDQSWCGTRPLSPGELLIELTLDIFSGLPNPTWTLGEGGGSKPNDARAR